MSAIRNFFARLWPRSFASRSFLVLLGFGFLIRLSVAPHVYPHLVDFSSWVQWGEDLYAHGFAHFYERVHTDRLPGGILNLLWVLAFTRHTFPFLSNELLYKLPSHIAEMVLAYLIFRHVATHWGRERAVVASALYFFNPFTWFISSVWAQMDAVQALLLVLTLQWYLRGYVVLSGIVFAYAFLFKPHSVVIAPLLLVISWLRRSSLRSFIFEISLGTLSVLGMLWSSSFPFLVGRLVSLRPISFFTFWTEPLRFVWERYVVAYDLFPYTSLNAFNIWNALAGNWQPDSVQFLGVSYRFWGVALFLLFSGTLLVLLVTSRRRSFTVSPTHYYVSAALLVLFAFTFLTRAHDRHIFPFFGLFAFGFFVNRAYAWSYVLMTMLSLLELTAYYQSMWGIYTIRPIIGRAVGEFLSFIPVLVSCALLYTFGGTLRKSKQSSRV